MHDYARSKGKVIVVGAQTNHITNEKYLKVFDYIEGGIGVYDDGTFESGPCLQGLWKKNGGSCWGLLWHKNFSSKAKNVILNLDWSGLSYDDMSRFARMNPELRIKTLRRLYRYFTSQDMGFLMPFLAVVHRENGSGCYGPNPEFYSPDNKYSCKDEDLINGIFEEEGSFNNGYFLMEDIPLVMTPGQKYSASVTFKNTGNSSWSQEDQFYLTTTLSSEGIVLSTSKFNLDLGEKVVPGQEKKFVFEITAPSVPGTYNFQSQVSQDPAGPFGDPAETVRIIVAAK
jgi:hypothetical protein